MNARGYVKTVRHKGLAIDIYTLSWTHRDTTFEQWHVQWNIPENEYCAEQYSFFCDKNTRTERAVVRLAKAFIKTCEEGYRHEWHVHFKDKDVHAYDCFFKDVCIKQVIKWKEPA